MLNDIEIEFINACKNGYVSKMDSLLTSNPELINVQDSIGNNALLICMCAPITFQAVTVPCLVKHGINLNYVNNVHGIEKQEGKWVRNNVITKVTAQDIAEFQGNHIIASILNPENTYSNKIRANLLIEEYTRILNDKKKIAVEKEH